MTYNTLKKLVEGRRLPLCGKNQDGENVIIEQGVAAGVPFYKLTTAQHNNWCRIHLIYADGNISEYYKR